MQFAHNGYYKGSTPLGLNSFCLRNSVVFFFCLANALALITLNYLQLFFFNIIKKAKVSSNFFFYIWLYRINKEG